MKNRAVLVTGATGFIGRHLVAHLLDEGLRVFALTRTDNGSLSLSNSPVEMVRGDITNQLAVPDGVNTIYHCAGVIARQEEMEPVNVRGTENVVIAAIEQNCRLIHLSSAGVVGRAKKRIVDEETPCIPGNLYERTKFEAERIVRQGIKKGLKAQVLRPTTVFGIGRAPEEDSLLQLVRAIVAGTYRHIRGGRGIYNVVYAGEVARAMFALDSNAIPNGRVYIINTPVRFSEFASIVSDSVKKSVIRIGNIPYVAAFTAAALFSFLHLLTGKKRGLTFSRLNALTDARSFSQERLLHETGYRPLHNVDEYLKQLFHEYSRRGFLA